MPFSQCFHNRQAGSATMEDQPGSRFVIEDLTSLEEVATFHTSLDNFMPTALTPHPELAASIGVSKVFIKCEISRLGLPAYKILGASYAIYRYLRRTLDLPDGALTKLGDIAKAAQEAQTRLCCATDGNHGRAVTYMANLLRIPVAVFVPHFVPGHTIQAILSEGKDTEVTIFRIPGPYVDAEDAALKYAQAAPTTHLIQDNAIPELNDDSIVTWIMEGYRTILHELDSTLSLHNCSPALIVVPVGVGSLAQAVATHYLPAPQAHPASRVKIMTVEPPTAASLLASLRAGKVTSVETEDTILTGLNCGSISPLAFPILQKSVDFATTVDDWNAHEGVLELRGIGIDAGPIAGACVSALRGLNRERFGLNSNSVVVVIATEGRREYEAPAGPST